MRLLKWADTIKQPVPVSKEDLLRRVEKAEIVHLIVGGVFILSILFSIMTLVLVPTGSKAAWFALATIIIGTIGFVERTIKGLLKLEKYKAIWDKIDLQESELRQMQAKDL